MGLFSFLFPRPVFIGDAVFGQLRRDYFDPRTSKASFINEHLLFAPTGRSIGLYLDASVHGPTPAQQAFFRNIEWHYDALIPKLIPVIEAGFQDWIPQFSIRDFAAEFQLTDISIAEIDQPDQLVNWDWSFETVHDANHVVTIHMRGDTPLPDGFMLDG